MELSFFIGKKVTMKRKEMMMVMVVMLNSAS